MTNAVKPVWGEKVGFQREADTLSIHLSTHEGKGDVTIVPKKKTRFSYVLIQEQENELVEHCSFIERRLFGLKTP